MSTCYIPYASSPTGSAYIGTAKRPLMQNEEGYGFQGVLLQDEKHEKVQCSGCGEWFAKITPRHLQSCCALSIPEYKVKFGLKSSQGLISDSLSRKLSELSIKHGNLKPENLDGKRYRSRGQTRRTCRQTENLYATCPEQLKQALYEFIKSNHYLPTQRNRGSALYKTLVRRYGNFSKALEAHGLPSYHRRGTNMHYIFPDATEYSYNLRRFFDREVLYNLIMSKCPQINS
jgi:hypothetical protein